MEVKLNSKPKKEIDNKTNPINFLWSQKIPLRDGFSLNATIYKPKQEKPVPAIFTLTPYIADSYHSNAVYFAQNGYAFAAIDCRGRGNSEGTFEPNADEGKEGYDIVEWLTEQSWCDGSVAMWGGSYSGFNQWMTIKEFPPHLKTIIPVASSHMAVDFPIYRNIFFPYIIQWLTWTSGRTLNTNLFKDQKFWREKFRELYLNHLPFKELDRIVGNTSSYFQTWLKHPCPDKYWSTRALTSEQYKKLNIPILTITGHYDADQPGAMQYYKMHKKYSSLENFNHYLIIGPWDHAGTRNPEKKFGGLEFGENSLLDMKKLNKEWYDWIIKEGKKPEFLKGKVCYYLMGADKWKFADSLDSISNRTKRFFLNSNEEKANSFEQPGVLSEIFPENSQPDKYIYDPLDVRPAELETEDRDNYLTDQKFIKDLFGNGLIYQTLPFEENTEITGYVKFSTWISLNVPDTDFEVTLFEIMPDGSSIFLTQDFMRARYRESLKQEKLIIPGEINRYEFAGFTFFSRLIRKNSRLRLLIKSPNSIYIQKNYNSGGVVAEESGKDARTALITLYHDAEYQSYLEIPAVV